MRITKLLLCLTGVFLVALAPLNVLGQTITEIIDQTGDGVSVLINPDGVAVDSSGNVFVSGCGHGLATSIVFRITPQGAITKILDGGGDGVSSLDCPVGVAVDSNDNVFVAGFASDNVFKVTPGGLVTQIIDSSGDGAGALVGPIDVRVDGADNVYVSGFVSNNVFRITPGGVISEIIDSSGDGIHALDGPFGLAVDGSGNVYAAGFVSNNAFKITPGGTLVQIIDASGGGIQPLTLAHSVAADGTGNVYVTGNGSDNVFRISPDGQITLAVDASGDGAGNPLDNPTGVATDADGNVYVAAFGSNNVFMVTPAGAVIENIDVTGSGSGDFLDPSDDCITVDGAGNVYVTGTNSHNVFRIDGLSVCGNGVVELGEECDDVGESALCDDDCTFVGCGDGNLNATAGEACEADTDCPLGQICAPDCTCVDAPVCGDGVVELGEECDDGGESAICDDDCTFVECGDGNLNVTAGEACEADGDCPAGEICQSCGCVVPPPAQAFFDDFNRAFLGLNWVVDNPSFSIVADQLVEDSGARFQDAQMRFVGGQTETVDQYGKLQVVSLQTHTWGFIFRADGVGGEHYEVHLPVGSLSWRWERYAPGFVERVGTCTGDGAIAAGDWIGATIEGTGTATVVKVWRWSTDPDAGGPANILNWGPPDCIMTQDPGVSVDTGKVLGIRAYTGGSTASASADNWSGGDVQALTGPPPVCGNGVVELGEECDDGGESAVCDDDCTFVGCGDGNLNATAGEACEADTDCPLGQICAPDCTCVDAPVCGDGVVELGEECDDGGESAICDDDCTFVECGDGNLNVTAGEACEADGDCPAGEICQSCGCVVPPPAQAFFDDFNRAFLGLNWVVDNPSFSIVADQLVEDSGARFQDAQMRFVGGQTETVDQYGKLQVVSLQTHTWGFIFRADGVGGEHYEVHLPVGSLSWRWERYAPGFVERVGTCTGDGAIAAGDWIGATIEGTGTATVVKVWRWSTDPDAGGPANILSWGPPDCIMTQDPGVSVDTGKVLGIRAYTGGSTASASADNWSGGDVLALTGPPRDSVGTGKDFGIRAYTGSSTAGALADNWSEGDFTAPKTNLQRENR